MTKPSIFCLEGHWYGNLTDRTSVRTYLQLLEDMRRANKVIHRTVATRGEFEHYARVWPQRQYAAFRIGYFAFRGDRQRILLGKEEITIDELATAFAGKLHGKVLVFASCATMAAPDAVLQSFCATTGAKAIAGYTKDIDFIQSAAFDLVLLDALADIQENGYYKPLYTRMLHEHRQFVHGLGFRMATKDWSSPVKVARDAVDS